MLPIKVTTPPADAADGAAVEDAVTGHRSVLLDPQRGFENTAIYDYFKLAPGHSITGPAIVEVPTTTVVVSPTDTAEIDQLGNLVLHHHAKETS